MQDHPFHVDPRTAADEGDELSIQRRFRKALQGTGIAMAAVPNAGKRSHWEAARAKQEGLAAGFPDAIVTWSGGGSAYLEFKARAGTLSEAQVAWLNTLHRQGHNVGVFRSSATALAFLGRCGAPIAVTT